MKLSGIIALLTLCAACSTAPTDATWVGKDPGKADFSDRTNWSPPVIPTGIATVPPSGQPPRPMEPQVAISNAVTLSELRQTGGGIYGMGNITFNGPGWSMCGATSGSGINATVTGNVSLCPAAPMDFGYSQLGKLDGNATVLGGTFGADGPTDLLVTGSVVVDQTGALGVAFLRDGTGILHVQRNIEIKGSNTTLFVFIDPQFDIQPQTIIAFKAKSITGCFSKAIVTSPSYKIDFVCRPTEVEVKLSRIPGQARSPQATTRNYPWPFRAASRTR